MIEPLFLLMRWLQTVPLALLVFAPFEDRELRCDRRKGYLAAAAYVLLGSVALAALSPLTSLNGQRNIIARDASLVVMMTGFFYGWARVVRAAAVRKLLVGTLLLHYDLALQAISNVFAALILNEGYAAEVNAEAGSLTYDLCLLAANIITLPPVWYFCRRVLRRNLPALDDREASRGLGYLCVVGLLFTAAVYNPRFELKPEVPLFVAALIATDMITYYIFFQEIGAARRQEETARHLERYQMQYRQISARVEEARRLRHDMRHHLNTLGALNAQGKQAEITDYLKRYGTVYNKLEGQRLCGDPVVDSVLDYYLALAGEEGISVKHNIVIKDSGGIDPMDMTVLLGNCLENSMEALRELPREERRLEIDLQPAGAVLLLRVVNTCGDGGGAGEFTGWESFASARPGGGMGLRSVADIAEKYGGCARFRRGGGEFTVQAVLSRLDRDRTPLTR